VYVIDDTIHASAVVASESKLSRRALREALSCECSRVIVACDDAEAYELSRRYVPDVIVLSGGHGLDKIRRDHELAQVPVICIDGQIEAADVTARVRAVLRRQL
jgi:DNA-binding response OmpR family regulator